jgi:hypothetical protein
MGQPPMDQPMDQQPPMDNNMPPEQAPPTGGGENPDIDKLIELLNSNPDKAEGVYKYAKGIIGDDNVDNQQPPMDQPPMDNNIPPEQAPPAGEGGVPPEQGPAMESVNKMISNLISEITKTGFNDGINLDEITDELIGISNKSGKPTITKPTNKPKTLKSKMFRPVLGSNA